MKSIINALIALLFLVISCLYFIAESEAAGCPPGQVDNGLICVSSCTVLQGQKRTLHWDAYIYGEQPNRYCYGTATGETACQLNKSGAIAISFDDARQFWSGEFTYTGQTCPFDERGRFFGGTPKPFPYEGDGNMNGIPDDEEDWDGDGIPNGVDENPSKADNVLLDENNNNIPDNLEPYVDSLAKVEVVDYDVRCAGNPQCTGITTLANSAEKVSQTNRDLVLVIKDLGTETADKNDVRSLNYSITRLLRNMNDSIANTQKRLVAQARNSDDIFLSVTKNKVLKAIEAIDTSGGGGLTRTQANQLSYVTRKSNQAVREAQANGALINEVFNVMGNIEYALGDTQGYIDTLGLDLTEQLSALSTKIDGIASGGTPSNGTDLSGLESSVTGIKNLLGSPNQFVQPTPGVSGAFSSNFLFDAAAFKALEANITDLKSQYKAEVTQARGLLGINTQGFQNGDFKTHNLTLKNFNGQNVEYENKVFSALLDNANIIKSILLFIVVIVGIRMLGTD